MSTSWHSESKASGAGSTLTCARCSRASTASLAALVAALSFCVLPVAAGETHIVKTYKYKFIPEEITIRAGDTVRWVNEERRQYHNVWFREAGEEPTGEFFPEEFIEKTFDEPGRYPYVCEPHEEDRDMKGVVHVLP